mmetsp:Transcript_9200/g.14623  ORF Transcript_9200/g.14623 Transcript_9200/m.14623 type:complete len:218 (-) Transcript_9200:16-669(-)
MNRNVHIRALPGLFHCRPVTNLPENAVVLSRQTIKLAAACSSAATGSLLFLLLLLGSCCSFGTLLSILVPALALFGRSLWRLLGLFCSTCVWLLLFLLLCCTCSTLLLSSFYLLLSGWFLGFVAFGSLTLLSLLCLLLLVLLLLFLVVATSLYDLHLLLLFLDVLGGHLAYPLRSRAALTALDAQPASRGLSAKCATDLAAAAPVLPNYLPQEHQAC